jgi:hypothetical protein
MFIFKKDVEKVFHDYRIKLDKQYSQNPRDLALSYQLKTVNELEDHLKILFLGLKIINGGKNNEH